MFDVLALRSNPDHQINSIKTNRYGLTYMPIDSVSQTFFFGLQIIHSQKNEPNILCLLLSLTLHYQIVFLLMDNFENYKKSEFRYYRFFCRRWKK